MTGRYALTYLLFLALLFAVHFVTPMLGLMDDAWITYTYARNLAHGYGITFNINPVERVEGCTAFLHMALLAPFARLTDRLDLVAIAFNLLAWAGVGLLVWSFIRRRDGGKVGVLGLLTTGFALFGFSGLAWTWSGMEMPLVALAWLGAAKLHLWEREANRWPWRSAVVTVLAGLLRPDGILAAITLAISIWYEGRRRFNWSRAIVFCALVLGLFGGYWLWRWRYFGYFLPNTFYAKVSTTSLSLTMTGVYYLALWFFGMVLPLVTVIFMIRARGRRPAPRWVRVMTGLVATSVAYVLLVGMDCFMYHRFLLPSYAAMLLLFWWYGVGALEKKRLARRKPPEARGIKIAKAITLFFVLQVFYFIGRWPPQGLVHGFVEQSTRDWAFVAAKLEQSTPPDAKIATMPIGAMRYFSDRFILDLVGLTDEHIAHVEAPTGIGITGHEKYDVEYVLFTRRPELIFSWPGLMPPGDRGLAKWCYSNIGAEAQKRLLTDPRTFEQYRFVWFTFPEQRPIRRAAIERSRSLTQGEPNGETMAKGVIGMLRQDLVGQPDYAAFAPFSDADTAKIRTVFDVVDPRQFFQRVMMLDAGRLEPLRIYFPKADAADAPR